MSKASLGKNLRRTVAIAGVTILWASLSPIARAGDPKAGADVFKSECSECHTTRQGKNKKGPSLFGIVGRHAGSIADYDYSDALKHAQWTWTTDKLHSYLSQPAKQANPGTKMKYGGLDDPRQLDDLLSYLDTFH